MSSILDALFDALHPLLPVAGLVWLTVHGLTAPVPDRTTRDPVAAFQAAIVDAAARDERNLNPGLLAINDDNRQLVWRTAEHKELLVVRFVNADDIDKHYRNADGSPHREVTRDDQPPFLWVTLVPELQRFCRRLGLKDPTERLKQYLGLSPTTRKDFLVEMWVRREDLFRPCPDPEVTDNVCELQTRSSPPTVPKVEDYRHFLLSLYEHSYRRDGAPWTGLGYTYDWAHGERGFGASEFMLVPGASYEVHSIQSPAGYCTR